MSNLKKKMVDSLMTIKDYEVNEQQFSYLIIHNIVILVQ